MGELRAGALGLRVDEAWDYVKLQGYGGFGSGPSGFNLQTLEPET